MTKEMSLYLDICRFLAAVMVFLSHVAARQISGGFLWQFGAFGEDAVAVFFVLSGFVIAYVTADREDTARQYAVSRFARIYSVALPALLFTFALDALGSTLRPDLYSAEYISYAGDHPAWQFAAGFLFLNELWNTHTVIGSNSPYWSLGFETWYYLVFGLWVFAPARWRWPSAALALLVAGPKIAVLFPLWLIGVVCFKVMARHTLSKGLGWLAFLGGAGAFLAWHMAFAGQFPKMFAPLELTWARTGTTVYFTMLGLFFALHLIGFAAVAGTFSAVLFRFARQIRYIAGATFTLYLFHLPIMLFAVAASAWPVTAWQTRLIVLIVPLLACFVLAEVTERRKGPWRQLFEVLFSGRARRVPAKA